MQKGGHEKERSQRVSEVTDAWTRYYEQGNGVALGRQSVELTMQYQRFLACKLVEEISHRLESKDSLFIWSAGSGVDKIALRVKALFRNSVKITLMDISDACMSANRTMFNRYGLDASFLVGDIFKERLEPRFDVIFNTGLLEHFQMPDQERLLTIFSRSLLPGGSYLTVTPWAGGKIYGYCKKRMMEKGMWPYGPEDAIGTLKTLDGSGLSLIEEYPIASLDQFEALIPCAFPIIGTLSRPAVHLAKRYPSFIEPILLRILGGYCLFDKFVKYP
jgi:ubiquinone/menaquinone biosynthesis C-methylase UbiE